jgi:hypothetical protein
MTARLPCQYKRNEGEHFSVQERNVSTFAYAGIEKIARPPHEIILREFRRGKVVPFLGAAASRVGFRVEDSAKFFPGGRELTGILARAAEFPVSGDASSDSLAKVASYYVNQSSRGALRGHLRDVFCKEGYQANGLHDLIARLANGTVIVTTNYDTLLEQAFKAIGKPYDLAVYPADNDEYRNAILLWKDGATEPEIVKPNQLDVDEIGKRNLIYKMHGSICRDAEKWDSYVITEEDYVEFLSRMSNAVPAAFRRYFSSRAFLFLGYSLRDWNLRVLLNKVTAPTIKSWAILKKPAIEEMVLWNSRNVVLFDESLEDFVQNMAGRLAKMEY